MNKGNKLHNAWELMDITGEGHGQFLTYTQQQVQNCIEAQILCVRKLIHGKLRSNLRLTINEATAWREKEAQERKPTKTIKSITGQHQYCYNADVGSFLLQDGSTTTGSVQIHNKLTSAFVEHFVCPQHHIHSPLQSDDGI